MYLRNLNFNKSDAFIGFQNDTPASVIFYATNQLRQALTSKESGQNLLKSTIWQDMLLPFSSESTAAYDIKDLNSKLGKSLVSYYYKLSNIMYMMQF